MKRVFLVVIYTGYQPLAYEEGVFGGNVYLISTLAYEEGVFDGNLYWISTLSL